MKVLMTADTVGGVWTYSLELARALRPHDVSIALFTMGKKLTNEQRREVEQLENVELYESSYKLEWMEEPWDEVTAAGECMLEVAAKFSPDLVHLNGYAHAALRWSVPKLVACHSCVLSWWKAVRPEPLPEAWSRYRENVMRGLHAAHFVVAPSRAMLSAIGEQYGEIQASCAVIPNGIDTELYSPGTKRAFVFSAGRLWDQAKNLAVLEEVGGQIEWPIYVAGDLSGPSGNTNSRPLTSNFRALGLVPRKDLVEWMATASIYCAPARYEPFGLSILEAALSGCALVLGDIASLREIWDGVAIFVDPDDCKSITGAINQLIKDSAHREEHARGARLRATEFTSERMAASYFEVYRKLVSSTSGERPVASEAVTCAS